MPVDDCPNNDCDTLENSFSKRVVWTIPTDRDTNWVLIGQVVSTSDKIICIRLREKVEGTIFCLDLETGKTLWEWGDPYITSGYFISKIHVHNDKVIVETWSDLFVLDINSGQTIWSNIVKGTGICGSPRSTLINDHIYYTLSECGPEPAYNFMMRTPVSHFAPDTLFKIYRSSLPGKDSGWISGMEPPSLWINLNSDSVLIFQDRAFKLGSLNDKVDMYAVKLKDKSLIWEIDSVALEGNSSVFKPVVDGNYMFFPSERSLIKIDLINGTALWRYKFTGAAQNTLRISPIDAGDKILMHPSDETLYAIDKISGNLQWKIENVGLTGPYGGMALHDNLVTYIAAPELYDIDHITGKVINHYRSPNKYRGDPVDFNQFAYTVKIPGTNYIFTSDERFGMLIRDK